LTGVVLVLLCLGVGTALAASGEGGGGKGWVATDTYRVMNFVVLVVALILLLRKPLSQALSSRIKTIKEQLESLETQKAEAEKKLAQYNDKLSQLESEAEKIVQGYIQQGNEARAKILKEAEATAEKLQIQAKRNIENEFGKARQELQREVVEKSLVQAEEMLKKAITDEDQDKLVNEYLDKVVA
jgi:F-type H+-transporting ATPase subunit b